MKGRSEECLNGFSELLGTDLFIGESQQVSKVQIKLVPECHTHPENQIHSSMIGFIGDKGQCVKVDLMLLWCVWLEPLYHP